MKYRFASGADHHRISLSSNGRRVLASTIAGSWYPGGRDELRETIEACLAAVETEPPFAPNILILPHAGMNYSGAVAACGIRSVLDSGFKRVVILAPSHRVWQQDTLIVPEAEAVSTPLGEIPVDKAAIERLKEGFSVLESDAVHAAEHSIQIQYPMLQYALKEFTVTPVIVGSIGRSGLIRAAAALRRILDDGTLLVVSSDFTHYGADFHFAPFDGDALTRVRELDLGAFALIRDRDVDGFSDYVGRTGATICGVEPIRLMLAALPGSSELELLAYATSADGGGDDSRFVCYLAAAGRAKWGAAEEEAALTPDEKRALLGIARASIRHVFDTGTAFAPDHFSAESTGNMRREMGCFVTLSFKKDHRLRGCIGEIQARRPLFEAVAGRAVDSAFRDPRFPALSPEEFERISIEISALTPEHPVGSWHDIVIGKHGMTLRKHGRSAVFLPQVAPEQGWDLETALTCLAQKAGLRPDDWREGAEFTVFEAIVFNEEEFTL